MRTTLPAAVALAFAFAMTTASAQTARIASDFEIQQMEQQAAVAHDFASQLSAHLNLGDVRAVRNEPSISRAEYRIAAQIAQRERADARRAGDISRYVFATTYAALAEAKLRHPDQAFALIEEATRYESDDSKTWNVYASTMHELQQPRKAESAARNAVAVAEIELKDRPSTTRRIDFEICRYSLATALEETRKFDESRSLLESIVASLGTSNFDSLRKDAARSEAFETYSTVKSDVSAYLSLLNKAQLQLASLYERDGSFSRAEEVYRDVLKSRTDDATALTALARLSRPADRAKSYAEAFDANPFSIDLITDYRKWLSRASNDGAAAATLRTSGEPAAKSDGTAVRHALDQMARGENRAARETLDALLAKFPNNDVLQYLAATNDIALGDLSRARGRAIQLPDLRQDVAARLAGATAAAPAFLNTPAASVNPSASELRQLLAALQQQRITPEQRVTLDRVTFTSGVIFEPSQVPAKPGQTVFESGTIEGLPFRFTEPTAFAGEYASGVPLRLSYRVLGATQSGGGDALLLEPVKLEVAR